MKLITHTPESVGLILMAQSLITDLVCGMIVDEANALSAECCGVTYHFCGTHCQRRFLAQAQQTQVAK